MAILVVCQSCKTRFQVNEKFAGKQGPCPKCKAVITIPKLEEQVVIHAPEEYAGGGMTAAKDAKGRAVLKPISRDKTRFQPVVFIAASAGALVTVIVAYLLRNTALLSDTMQSMLILGLGAAVLAPPIVLASYTIMRDAELEPYTGKSLWLRVAIVSLVYAGLWGVAALFTIFVYPDNAEPEVWQFIPGTAIMIVAGTLTAVATLDLEPLNAFFHYAFYLVVTVLLRIVMGLPPLGGVSADQAAPTATVGAEFDAAQRATVVTIIKDDFRPVVTA
jgi:hypothetical protein